MKTVTLSAHVEGKAIRLDDPFDLVDGAKLLITVLPQQIGNEREDWVSAAKAGLARGYSDAEPDYPTSLIKE